MTSDRLMPAWATAMIVLASEMSAIVPRSSGKLRCSLRSCRYHILFHLQAAKTKRGHPSFGHAHGAVASSANVDAEKAKAI